MFSVNNHEAWPLRSALKLKRHSISIRGAGSITPFANDQIEMSTMAIDLPDGPLDEIRRLGPVITVNISPDSS